jgi:signal transduction histidine kinase
MTESRSSVAWSGGFGAAFAGSENPPVALSRPLRILHLEDDALDAELARAAIHAAKIPAEIRRVETEEEFRQSLERPEFDLILADFALPSFDGISALEIAHRLRPELPFIFVSGTLGEEIAIDSLKQGATDYVLKQRLKRLPLAIARAVAEMRERVRRREAEIELRRAVEAAEAANKAKDYFFATLSHELRTPLNPVLAAASILEADPHVSGELRNYVEMIRRNAEIQARLIDDLLDLTRIAQRRIDLHLAPTDVHTTLRRTLEMCGEDLRRKPLALTLDLAAREHWVTADAARLQQVFWNLVRNAIKYTPAHGSITVATRSVGHDGPAADLPPAQLALAQRLGGKPAILVSVQDSGIGFSPEFSQRIFNAFEQADATIARKYGGLGLGLAIAKAVLDAHHGEIDAHSDGPNSGATFFVALPLDPTPAAPPIKPTPRIAEPPSRAQGPLNILLVEDHLDTVDVMTRLLKSFGHQVTTASSVAEALAAAHAAPRAAPFDLIISDIGLPDGTGLDFLSRLRHENASDAPAIALSGYGMEHDKQRCQDAGFLTHLTKPVDVARLQNAIREVLATGRVP